jgi:hypothetical protein
LGTNAGIILELGDRRLVRNGLIRNDWTDEKGVAMWLVIIHTYFQSLLEVEIGTGTGGDIGPDRVQRSQRVVVWNGLESAIRSSVDTAAEIVTPLNSITTIRRKQPFLDARENVVLDQNLRTISGIDCITDVIVEVVENAGIVSEHRITEQTDGR